MPQTKTPLRYPGGKTQIAKFIKHIINLNQIERAIYCEPFSGGAGVAMELLLSDMVDSLILNDLDTAIFSFWHAILYDTQRFIEKINDISIDINTWHQQHNIYNSLKETNEYNFDLAFATFFLNRTNRAGIISGGPIGGFSQGGKYLLNCRFNKDGLINKIKIIASFSNKIKLYHLDAINLIEEVLFNQPNDRLFIFFDPPYYKQGKNLYKNSFTDKKHRELFNCISKMDDYHWIVTYDNEVAIENIYNEKYQPMKYSLQYSVAQKRKEHELFFHSPNTLIENFDKVFFE